MSGGKSIKVEATGSLKQYLAPDTTIQNVSTVGEAISQLALPDVGELMLLVNGKMAYWQTELQDGDVLKLVPAIGGGRK